MTGPPGDYPARGSPFSSDLRPGVKTAMRLQRAAGTGERYTGLDDAALMVAAGRWRAVESWACARTLAAVRELIRRMPLAGRQSVDGSMPGCWRADLGDQVACELAIAQSTADALVHLAWTLEVRLPLTGAALDAGVLDYSKAKMLAHETSVLTDELARQAEALVAGKWAGQTWSMLRRLIALAVIKVDPDGATRRREEAERREGQVRFWREASGAAGIAGYQLPADDALKANQAIQNRARAYKKWGLDLPMDLLRVQAYLDLLNGTDYRHTHPKPDKNTTTGPGQDTPDGNPTDPDDGDGGDGGGGTRNGDGGTGDNRGNGDGWTGDNQGNGDGGTGDGDAADGWNGHREDEGLAANLDLTIPFTTLAEQSQEPGEAGDLGAVDPGLARRLAAAAVRHPRTDVQVIVTDNQGRAIGFGHALRTRNRAGPGPPGRYPIPGLEAARQTGGNGKTTGVVRTGAGPPGGYGTWTLTIEGTRFTVTLAPVHTGDPCDHRFESKGYQPSDTLRRLVKIRDGRCVFPACQRRARGVDWDHVIPWPLGRSCNCNGEARCRHDHVLKQDPGWTVRLRPDGTHQWTTPLGLTYTKGAWRYPS